MDDNANKDQPVTISAPPAPPVTIDPQNPLPEPSFFWRRVIACSVAAFALVMAWWTAGRLYELQDAQRLYDLTRLVLMGAGLILTYYFVAPSAAELTSMIQTARLQRQAVTAAATAAESVQNRPDSGQGARFGPSVAADSQIPESAPGGPENRPSGDSADSGEIDAAPRGRS